MMGRSTSTRREIQYVIRPNARPRNVRMDSSGVLWGEFPITSVRETYKTGNGKKKFVVAEEDAPSEPEGGPSQSTMPEVPEDVPGWELKPDPLEATTVAEFVEAMGRYRVWAGEPSYRKMARRVGTGSAAGFCEALKANRLPKFALLNAFVVSLGGNAEDFQRWATAWRALGGRVSGRPIMLLLPRSEEAE